MFFAYVALRPVTAELLEPPLRLPLWSQTLARFFPWVWIAAFVLPATGYWTIIFVFEGFRNAGAHVHVMQATGWTMILLFLYAYLVPFQHLRRAVAGSDWPNAGRQLGQIRMLIGINLILGLATVIIATGGRYLGDYLFSPR